MINSRSKFSTSFYERDIITLVLTLLGSFLIIKNAAYIETGLLLVINLIIIGNVIAFSLNQSQLKLSSIVSQQLINFTKAYASLILIAALIYYFNPQLFLTLFPDEKMIIAFVLGFPAMGVPLNFLVGSVINHIKHNRERKHTLIAGVGNLAANIEKKLSGRDIKGYINCRKEECLVKPEKIIGEIDQIQHFLEENPVDEIVIAIPVKPSKKIKNIIMAADHYGVRVKYIPDYQGLLGDNYKATRYGRIEAINVRQYPLDDRFSIFMKRSFDFLFAGVAFLALMPLFVLVAILIKLDSSGPIFYCPERIGKSGRSFKVFKFRSMSVCDSTVGGTQSTQKNDPRVTKIGRVLRKYSIDELPQFLNVLLGDMSVVGPRPHRSHLNKVLRESEEKYMLRHYYRPGITGWAQVNGWRGPTETKEQKSQRTLHDLWYLENWSFLLDIKIIFMTIFDRRAHKNAY